MKAIRHLKVKRLRKSISIPEPLFNAARGNASRFEDFSKYVQSLMDRDVAGELPTTGKQEVAA